MDTLRMAAIIVLIAVICIGTVIKVITSSKLKSLEGTYDMEPGGAHRRKEEK
jgi:hypothetical protein